MHTFLIQIFILIILFVLAAFFSASETALIAISRMRIKKLITELPKKAKGFKLWLEDPNKLLTTLLIGINTVAVLSSALATSVAIRLSEIYNVDRTTAISISAAFVTLVIIIFGEVSPKIFAIRNSEKFAIFSIKPLFYIDKLLTPFTRIFVFIGGLIVGKASERNIPILTAEDVRTMISVGQEVGIFSIETKQMMHSVLNFPQLTAKSIMTPLEKIEMVNIDIEKEKLIDLIVETSHSRVPVYKNHKDNIIGMIYERDLLNMWRSKEVFVIDDLLRPVISADENKKISELMRQFKKGESHVAIIKNSQSKVVGLLTIEDIIEEVFGEILDEYDIENLFKG
jgi:putative hemolysin